MNKYTKNMLWFNLSKIITFTVIAFMTILTISVATSCTTTNSLSQYHNHKSYPCAFTN